MVNWNYIERLLLSSSDPLKHEIRERLIWIDSNWSEFAEVEYYDLISRLIDTQLDPITSGLNYLQKDIVKHLNKLK